MSSRSRSTTRKSTKRSRSMRSRSTRPRSSSLLPRRTLAVAKPAVGLGTSATTVLRTSFFNNIVASGATGVATGYLKPGSCFDPCGDLANIQPQMFDQFAAMYSRYKVNSCTIRIKINGTHGIGASPVVWVMAAYPAVDPTALTTYQAAASQQFSKTTSGGFTVQSLGGSVYGTGAEGKIITFKLNHDSIVGNKSDAYDSGALVTADPTAGQFMVLPMFLQGSVNGAHGWTYEIDIFQNVTFSQKKNTIDA